MPAMTRQPLDRCRHCTRQTTALWLRGQDIDARRTKACPNGCTYLGELVSVLWLKVSRDVPHEAVQAGNQLGLALWQLACQDAGAEFRVHGFVDQDD